MGDHAAALEKLRALPAPPIHSGHGALFAALLPSASDAAVSSSAARPSELQDNLNAAVAACCARASHSTAAASAFSAAATAAAEDFLAFAQESPLLRVTWADVPRSVLPASVAHAALADVKVCPPRHESDDNVYCSRADIRSRVSRGNCVLRLELERGGGGGGGGGSCMVLQSFRKFTGSLGDEDDDVKGRDGGGEAAQAAQARRKAPPAALSAQRWEQFFLQPPSAVTSAVVMAKANGEAAHLSAIRLEVRGAGVRAGATRQPLCLFFLFSPPRPPSHPYGRVALTCNFIPRSGPYSPRLREQECPRCRLPAQRPGRVRRRPLPVRWQPRPRRPRTECALLCPNLTLARVLPVPSPPQHGLRHCQRCV